MPIGGGGLASGVAAAVKGLRPDIRVVGVEPELAADARDSLRTGEIVRWSAADVSRTIADGTRTQALGERTFAHLRAHLDGIVTVTEAEIAAGVRLAAERGRLVVEPSGALSVAALAFHAAELAIPAGRESSPSISGGNVDPEAYRDLPRGAAPRLSSGRPSARSRASRSASRASRMRISASSTAARRSVRAASRASARDHPSRIAKFATRKIRSPTTHMNAAPICWSSSGVGPHVRVTVA